uniref:Uncharacterized protein n=1 Tax=Anguilla anguilla TaxID=7936 RepID=A0A0E9UD53_ANGAN
MSNKPNQARHFQKSCQDRYLGLKKRAILCQGM